MMNYLMRLTKLLLNTISYLKMDVSCCDSSILILMKGMFVMSKKLIYYFSGTGNSLNAAIQIAKGISPATIISMRNDPAVVPATDAQVIGFVFPVHNWSLPAYVKEFIQKLSINPKAYIFAIACCGGISVNSLNDFAQLMKEKNTVVSYSAVLRNVSSYVAAYPPFPAPEKQLPKTDAQLTKITQEISQGSCTSIVKPSLRKELMRKFIVPSTNALAEKDKGFHISDTCISCGLCAKICTPKNIIIKDGKPEFQHHCSQCMSCIVYCPKHAIDYKNVTQKRLKYHHPDITAEQMLWNSHEF